MPSTTTVTVEKNFTHRSTYSWSENGMYDDQTGYTTCNVCHVMVADEYGCLSPEEVDVHISGLCAAGRVIRVGSYAMSKLFENLMPKVPCEYCHETPCDCPF